MPSNVAVNDRNQALFARYTMIDFAKDFLKDVLFNIFIWCLYKIGRALVNQFKPVLKEAFMYLKFTFKLCVFLLETFKLRKDLLKIMHGQKSLVPDLSLCYELGILEPQVHIKTVELA